MANETDVGGGGKEGLGEASVDQLDDGGMRERVQRFLAAKEKGEPYIRTLGELELMRGNCQLRAHMLLQDLKRGEIIWDLEEQAFGIGRQLDLVEKGLARSQPDIRRDLELITQHDKILRSDDVLPDQDAMVGIWPPLHRPPRDFYAPPSSTLIGRRDRSFQPDLSPTPRSLPPHPSPAPPPQPKPELGWCQTLLEKKKACLAAMIIFLVTLVTLMDLFKSYLTSSTVVEALKTLETVFNYTASFGKSAASVNSG